MTGEYDWTTGPHRDLVFMTHRHCHLVLLLAGLQGRVAYLASGVFSPIYYTLLLGWLPRATVLVDEFTEARS